jgi:hypothetical protein
MFTSTSNAFHLAFFSEDILPNSGMSPKNNQSAGSPRRTTHKQANYTELISTIPDPVRMSICVEVQLDRCSGTERKFHHSKINNLIPSVDSVGVGENDMIHGGQTAVPDEFAPRLLGTAT